MLPNEETVKSEDVRNTMLTVYMLHTSNNTSSQEGKKQLATYLLQYIDCVVEFYDITSNKLWTCSKLKQYAPGIVQST